MRIHSAAEVKELDRIATGELGVSLSALMEAAGAAVAQAASARLRPGGGCVVYAGPGNNGGDGFVAARLLREGGARVTIWLAGDPAKVTGAAKRALEQLGGPVLGGPPPALGPSDLAIDALLGTGLSRPPAERFTQAIEAMARGRALGARVVSVDVPTGLDADRGVPLGACVQADVTVTMAVSKRGLCLEPGASLAGELVVADIGIPAAALARLRPSAELLLEPEVRVLFAPRPRDGHKGLFGHLLVVAGSPGKAGAAALCVRGALRGGAGLVTLAARPEVALSLWATAPEAMGLALPGEGPLSLADLPALRAAAEGKRALALGPGIPRGPETSALLGDLLSAFEGPALLDADALNAVAQDLAALGRAKGPLVLTPHPGEMARLAGQTIAEVQADRLGVALRFARAHGVVVVLKGARTVVAAPDGELSIVPTGNPGMSTGGTGDALAGLIGALLAQGLPPRDAARAGAYVHGLAGDLAARRRGERGLIAGDVCEAISEVWRAWKL
ncbi:MAG: NAD(P)H-hydrate dehydratase [Deltaproteobacteria bacterium]